MGFAKIVCLQCSDQVWAKDSNSISVGFLFNLLKYSFMTCIEDKSSASGPLRLPTSSWIPSLPILINSSSLTPRSTFITGFLFFNTTLGTWLGKLNFPFLISLIYALSIKELYAGKDFFLLKKTLEV